MGGFLFALEPSDFIDQLLPVKRLFQILRPELADLRLDGVAARYVVRSQEQQGDVGADVADCGGGVQAV